MGFDRTESELTGMKDQNSLLSYFGDYLFFLNQKAVFQNWIKELFTV